MERSEKPLFKKHTAQKVEETQEEKDMKKYLGQIQPLVEKK